MKPESDGEVIVDERLHRLLTQALAEYNDSGSSARIERLLVMTRPADLDAGEITDKGYVNQRKVLACRSALVAMLYADQVPPGVVVAGKMASCSRECRDHLGHERAGCELGRDRISVALAGYSRQPVRVIDPAIESHYGTGYERSRLFPGGNPSLEFVRSMELLDRLLPGPPARLLDVGGGPGTYAAPLARRGYRVHLVDPVPLHVEQARQAAGRDRASGFSAAEGDARELAEQAGSQDAVLLFGPLYHLTGAAQRRQALAEARRVLRPGGRLLAMAVCRFASLLDGLYEDWLDDPDFRPIVEQDLLDGQHRNPDPVGRPEFFTTAYFHTPDGLAGEIERTGFTGVAVYGVEGPGWPLRREWADPHRREQILFAARAAETQPSLLGFSHHLIAAATKP